ncbi:uncharacterized protein LOC143429929 [Xylocopa sonorina]|uniref:uncharacterized protein LOC143429929 n=1 Tax=Xylocopa sonorina TaxID=1818115 RepID=UPI00403A8685
MAELHFKHGDVRERSIPASTYKKSNKVAFALLAVLALASPLYVYRLPDSGSGELAKKLQKMEIRMSYAAQDKQIRLGPTAPLAVSNHAVTGGIVGYIKDLGEVIPVQQLQAPPHQELQISKVIQKFICAVSSKENVDFYCSIYQNLHYLNLKEQVTQ